MELETEMASIDCSKGRATARVEVISRWVVTPIHKLGCQQNPWDVRQKNLCSDCTAIAIRSGETHAVTYLIMQSKFDSHVSFHGVVLFPLVAGLVFMKL